MIWRVRERIKFGVEGTFEWKKTVVGNPVE